MTSPAVGRLQAARAAASARYERIGLAMLEEARVARWTFHERGLHGRGSRDHVKSPRPTTRRRLYILAHECGHAALHHPGVGKGQPSHRKEYEAEQYAQDAMRRHGVPVPEKSSQGAKRYVAYRIDMAVRRHTRKLDREAVEWTRGYHRPATRLALASGRAQLVDMSRKRVPVSTPRPPVKAKSTAATPRFQSLADRIIKTLWGRR